MKLRVYGGLSLAAHKPSPNGSLQARTIVAASSRKRAVELLHAAKLTISLHYLNAYWSETGNRLELATAFEEGVWVNQGPEYAPVFERRL
jgi:hypothetical protein